jgi:DNA-binding GntR family transcriptional regulator
VARPRQRLGPAGRRWEAGEQIPTEAQLIEDRQCSRTTVRRAVDELCALGLLKRWAPYGTFVLPGAQQNARRLLDLDDGLPPSTGR